MGVIAYMSAYTAEVRDPVDASFTEWLTGGAAEIVAGPQGALITGVAGWALSGDLDVWLERSGEQLGRWSMAWLKALGRFAPLAIRLRPGDVVKLNGRTDAVALDVSIVVQYRQGD